MIFRCTDQASSNVSQHCVVYDMHLAKRLSYGNSFKLVHVSGRNVLSVTIQALNVHRSLFAIVAIQYEFAPCSQSPAPTSALPLPPVVNLNATQPLASSVYVAPLSATAAIPLVLLFFYFFCICVALFFFPSVLLCSLGVFLLVVPLFFRVFRSIY
jgi:hypothetical protein